MQSKSAAGKQDKRPQLVDCPICAAKKGEACMPARFGRPGETTEYPHNQRYLRAGIDYWTRPPEAP